jgi:hypothetical protein
MAAAGTKPQDDNDSEDLANSGVQSENTALSEVEADLAGDPIDQPSQ